MGNLINLNTAYAQLASKALQATNIYVHNHTSQQIDGITYLILKNKGTISYTLISAYSDIAERAQLYQSVKQGNKWVTVSQKSIFIPANSTFKFEPGSYYIKLNKLKILKRRSHYLFSFSF